MVKKKRTHRRRRSFTVPVAIIGGLAPGVINTVQGYNIYGPNGGTTNMGRIWTGYDRSSNRWVPSSMWGGTYPAVLGLVIHNLASRLGLNRMLGQARVPFIRI